MFSTSTPKKVVLSASLSICCFICNVEVDSSEHGQKSIPRTRTNHQKNINNHEIKRDRFTVKCMEVWNKK